MKSSRTKELGLYLLLVFGLAWLCQIGGCRVLIADNDVALFQLLLVLTMLCPLASVLIVKRLVHHEPTGVKWHITFRGHAKDWLFAWLGLSVLTAVGSALFFLVFPALFDTSGSYILAALGEDAVTPFFESGMTPMTYFWVCLAQGVTYAPLINTIPAVGEEAGWRGFMMPRLKEQFGLVKGRVIGGVIWAVWHFPVMLLAGYEYGTDYIGAPVLGLLVWCVVCVAVGTLLDWLYDKTGSIWAPALAHGAFNAAATIPALLTKYPDASRYAVFGPSSVGLIGALPILVVAILITVRQAKEPTDSTEEE